MMIQVSLSLVLEMFQVSLSSHFSVFSLNNFNIFLSLPKPALNQHLVLYAIYSTTLRNIRKAHDFWFGLTAEEESNLLISLMGL